MNDKTVPIATRWLLNAVSATGRSAVNSVYMVICPRTQRKGSGFLLRSGYLITNWHVVRDCVPRDVVAISCEGISRGIQDLVVDERRDLAALKPSTALGDGLTIRQNLDLAVGIQVHTWGFPLGYDGPAPILTMGWLSGFASESRPPVKHFVINAAFNPGNSGGPLLIAGEDAVVGVVVSKHAPISPRLLSVINALKNQQSGFVYTATDDKGNKFSFSEAQMVAEVLQYFREMTQVVIGEAIAADELRAFLNEHGIPSE